MGYRLQWGPPWVWLIPGLRCASSWAVAPPSPQDPDLLPCGLKSKLQGERAGLQRALQPPAGTL